MANFQTTLFPLIVDEIGAVPMSLLELHVNETVRDFCQETQVYQEIVDVQLVDGQIDYVFTPADPLEVELYMPLDAHLVWASGGVTPLEAVWDYRTSDNKVGWTLTLAACRRPASPVPGDLIRVNWAVRPTTTSTLLPDRVMSDWRWALMAGVKHRLMRMANKHWSDPQGAQVNLVEYIRGIRDARTELLRAQTAGDVNMEIPRGYVF
jgi:hypothetical protein